MIVNMGTSVIETQALYNLSSVDQGVQRGNSEVITNLEVLDEKMFERAFQGVASTTETIGVDLTGSNGLPVVTSSPMLQQNVVSSNGNTNGSSITLEYMELDDFLTENGVPKASSGPGYMEQLQPMAPKAYQVSLEPRPEPSTTTTYILQPPEPVSMAHHDHRYPEQTEQSPHSSSMSPPPPAGSSPPLPSIRTLGRTLSAEEGPVTRPISGRSRNASSDPETRQSRRLRGQSRYEKEQDALSQAALKRSRKEAVPDENKDEKYWKRRAKNNLAAKRSRDTRRERENQIAMRTSFLENENKVLKDEMEKLKAQNASLAGRLSRYETV